MRTSLIYLLAIALLGAVGCENTKVVEPGPQAAPLPTFRGPTELHGTIGSLFSLQGNSPITVSGIGLVVNLNGTGSPDCPPQIRGWLLNEMGLAGVGSAKYGFKHLGTPTQVLADMNTAVVKVEGVIPPGAPRGASFDIMVTALQQTQTSSLEGGTLWLTNLSINGADISNSLRRAPIATARGALFTNPFRKTPKPDDLPDATTLIASVPGGGRAIVDRPLTLIANKPSFNQTYDVVQKINGRFDEEMSLQDRHQVAQGVDDSRVRLNIPTRYRNNPQHLLDLISHQYRSPDMRFEQIKMREFAEMLKDPQNQHLADDIALVWEAMGQRSKPLLRELYKSEDPVIRYAALQAGARLIDNIAADPLLEFAVEGGRRAEDAARLLGILLKRHPENYRVARLMRQLIDHDLPTVRVAAYEALENVNDPLIRRFNFENKCIVASVESEKPMLYIVREGTPKIIVFGTDLKLQFPLNFWIWNNTFMINGKADDRSSAPIAMYYRPPSPLGKAKFQGERHNIPNDVTFLVGKMADKLDAREEESGFDMTYSQIVRVLHDMTEQGFIEAPFVLQTSTLAQQIARGQIADLAPQRDEGETLNN